MAVCSWCGCKDIADLVSSSYEVVDIQHNVLGFFKPSPTTPVDDFEVENLVSLVQVLLVPMIHN